MTRGISEESLRHVMKMHDMEDTKVSLIFSHLSNECTELNPWKPIENAPLGRRIRLFDGECQLEGRLYEEIDRKIFTHWCELPDDPH